MKNALLFVSLAASPVCADEATSSVTSASNSSTVTTTLVVPASQVGMDEPSVLDSYGVVSSQHLMTALNANLTSAQRAQLEQALAARNASVAQANRQLSATLQTMLGETNQSINERIMAPTEAHRMEAMRRAQPARYLHLMSKKRQELKKRQQQNAGRK